MPDDREPESDAQHRDAEEERRQHREGQQDLEQETQPPSSGPSGGKSPEEGEEGDTVGSRDYSPGDLTVPDVWLEDVAEAELVKLVTTGPVIEQARRNVTIPELSLPGIDVGTTSVNVATDAPDIAAEGKEWQIPLVQLGSAPIVQFQLTSFDSKIREPPKRRRQPLSVPLYRRVSTPRVRSIPAFNDAVDKEIHRRPERLQSDDTETAAVQETKV